MHRTFLPLLALLGLLLVTLPANAQIKQQVDVMPMKIDIALNDLGDATITFEMSMTAQQWAAWKKQYGDNPSLLRREMSGFVSQYVVDDFDLEQDDMARTMKMTVKARGVARHLGGGEYELELEPHMGTGDPEDGGQSFRFNYTEPQDATSLITVNQEITLPDDVEEPEQGTNSSGKPVLSYRVDVDDGGTNLWLLIIGIIVTLAGLAMLPLAFSGRHGTATTSA
jgi:hypothetical protein